MHSGALQGGEEFLSLLPLMSLAHLCLTVLRGTQHVAKIRRSGNRRARGNDTAR